MVKFGGLTIGEAIMDNEIVFAYTWVLYEGKMR